MEQHRQDPIVLFDETYSRCHNPVYCNRLKQLRFELSKFTNEQILSQKIPTFNQEDFKQKIDAETDQNKKQDWSTQRYLALQFSNMFRVQETYFEYCPACWMTMNMCVCSRYNKITEQDMTSISPHTQKVLKTNLLINMHVKEFYRSSNTAKVMAGSIQGTEFFISGLDMHDEELEREYWEKSKTGEKHVAVLFPSEDSLTFEEYFKDKDVEEFTLVIVDGTWSNARNLNRRVPEHVPRIRISPPSDYQNLFSTLRQQSSQQRISTLEATMMAIRDIYGDNPQMNQTADNVIENLKTMINNVKKLIGRKDMSFAPKRPVKGAFLKQEKKELKQ